MGERVRLACDNPDEMWMLVADRSDRKLRLLVVALCRQLWNVFRDQACRNAVEVAERFADGLANEGELYEAHISALDCIDAIRPELYLENAIAPDSTGSPMRAQLRAAEAATDAAGWSHHLHNSYERALDALGEAGDEDSRVCAVALFREIYGNRFLHPVTFDPAWRTSDVMALANGIYAERAFDRMPILADALQDAGCDNADILGHMRDAKATHVRGCWALDLILGKE